jgi:hypothetical protein
MIVKEGVRIVNMLQTFGVASLFGLFVPVVGLRAAELAVGDVSIPPGTTANVLVSGSIANESTFGVTIMLEIIPRAGARGVVRFTPSPPNDIVQLGDSWPEAGTFTPYDTDYTFSETLNGSADDNGTFIPAPVSFAGTLSSFPISANADAAGVWDLVLATSAGDSSWEGLPTTLTSGTITVISDTNVPAVSTWGLLATALSLLVAGTLVLSRRQPA